VRPPGRAFAFSAPLCAVPGKQKPNPSKGADMKYAIERRPLFPLGELVATPGALAALQKAGQSPAEFLSLHVRGQWGDISEEDRRENEYSLQHGFRLLSSYRTNANETIWLVTESDRSVTTLPKVSYLRHLRRVRTHSSRHPPLRARGVAGAWLFIV